ncbi:hypothetical protein D3C77_439970 [compost metagenome]
MCQAAVERIALTLQQHHWNAGIGEVHGDAAAHGAGTDYCNFGNRAQRSAGVDARYLAGLAFGKEHMAQRFRLAGGLGLLEQGQLTLQALLQGQQASGLDCREYQAWGQAAFPAGFLLQTIALEEIRWQPFGGIGKRLARARGCVVGN